MKRYESTLGPSFDTNTIGAIITRTNTGTTSYEYKVTADGYTNSTEGTKVVVKYGPSSAEAKKEFWFDQNVNYFYFYTYIEIEEASDDQITEYINVEIPYEDANSVGYFDYSTQELNDFTGYNFVICQTYKNGTGTGTTDYFESTANIQFTANASNWNLNGTSYCKYKIYFAVMNYPLKVNEFKHNLSPWNSPNSFNNLPTFARIDNSQISGPGNFNGDEYYVNGYTKDALKYLQVKLLNQHLSKNSFSQLQGIEVYCRDDNTHNPGTVTAFNYKLWLSIYNRMGISAPRVKVLVDITF